METRSANTLGNVKYQQHSYSTVYKGFILFKTYRQVINKLFNSSYIIVRKYI